MEEQPVPMSIPKVTQLVGLDNPFPQNKPKSHVDLTQELFSGREKKSQRDLCYAFGNNFKVGELKGLEIIECDLCDKTYHTICIDDIHFDEKKLTFMYINPNPAQSLTMTYYP